MQTSSENGITASGGESSKTYSLFISPNSSSDEYVKPADLPEDLTPRDAEPQSNKDLKEESGNFPRADKSELAASIESSKDSEAKSPKDLVQNQDKTPRDEETQKAKDSKDESFCFPRAEKGELGGSNGKSKESEANSPEDLVNSQDKTPRDAEPQKAKDLKDKSFCFSRAEEGELAGSNGKSKGSETKSPEDLVDNQDKTPRDEETQKAKDSNDESFCFPRAEEGELIGSNAISKEHETKPPEALAQESEAAGSRSCASLDERPRECGTTSEKGIPANSLEVPPTTSKLHLEKGNLNEHPVVKTIKESSEVGNVCMTSPDAAPAISIEDRPISGSKVPTAEEQESNLRNSENPQKSVESSVNGLQLEPPEAIVTVSTRSPSPISNFDELLDAQRAKSVSPPPIPDEEEEEEVTPEPVQGIDIYPPRVLFCLSRRNPFRRLCMAVFSHPNFERAVNLLIVVNCIFLAIEDPAPGAEDSPVNRAGKHAELFLTLAFSLEVVIKVTALGLICTPKGYKAYMHDGWNVLDFMVVGLGWLVYLPNTENMSGLRTFRLLRPLRTISGNPGLRMLVLALVESIPLLVDVFLLWMFVFIVFGIIGMQLWLGKFHYHCVPEDDQWAMGFDHMQQVCGNIDCEDGFVCVNKDPLGHILPNPNWDITSFDNFWYTFLIIFATMTLEGWVQFKFLTDESASEWAVWFWIVLIFFGAFFVVNLATAVVFANFTRMALKEQERQDKLLESQGSIQQRNLQRNNSNFGTTIQHRLSKMSSKLSETGRKEALESINESSWSASKFQEAIRAQCHRLVEYQHFQSFVMLVIFLNTLALAIEHAEMDSRLEAALSLANVVFTAFFSLECALKLYGLSRADFWSSRANIFDLVVVLVSIIELCIPTGGPSGLSVLRTFRLLRVLKIFKNWTSMSHLVHTVSQTLGAIANFTVILGIVQFTFSLIGVQFFYGTMCAEYSCSNPALGLKQLCNKDAQRAWALAHPDSLQWAESIRGLEIDQLPPPVWYCSQDADATFDNMWWAFLTTFQVFTAENWHVLMYQAAAGSDSGGATGVFFVFQILAGNYILMNLFLAGIVRNVVEVKSESEHGGDDDDMPEDRPDTPQLTPLPETPTPSELERPPPTLSQESSTGSMPRLADDAVKRNNSESVKSKRKSTDSMRIAQLKGISQAGFGQEVDDSAGDGSREEVQVDSESFGWSYTVCQAEVQKKWEMSRQLWLEQPTVDMGTQISELHMISMKQDRGRYGLRLHSLFLFSPENTFRVWCYKFVNYKRFDHVIVVCICVSSLSLAVESPHDSEGSTLTDTLMYLDYFFTAVFTVEMSLKVVAAGFVWPRSGGLGVSYLHEPWNRLDALIVAVSLMSLGLQNDSLSSLKALRTLRALRPLRLLTHNEGMKAVISALIAVVPSIGNILVLVALAWIMFAILGVQLFAGRMGACTDPAREWKEGYGPMGNGEDECVGLWGGFVMLNSTDAGLEPQEVFGLEEREWKVYRPHFDNSLEALLTLFEMATLEDWDQVMYRGMAAREVGQGPQSKASPQNALYFIFYIMIGSLFVTNIMVSAVVSHYMRVKYSGKHGGDMTKQQEEWMEVLRGMVQEKPERIPAPPTHPLRLRLFKIVTKPRFEYAIMSVIAMNVLTMLCDHFAASDEYILVIEWINILFSFVFILEALAKILAMGFEYWVDHWNRFDFFIVCLSVLGMMSTLGSTGMSLDINPTMMRVFRIFRTARVLRMVRSAKGLRMLLRTFLLSLPSLWNVGSLLLMVFFVYSVLGMYLLGDAAHEGAIDVRTNFESFTNAMFLLLRACTGENWNSVYHHYLDHSWVATPFFISFLLLVYFVMLNLFVAVILENFSQANRLEESKINTSDFAAFSELWKEYDPRATHVIPSYKLVRLLKKLPPPLGFQGLTAAEMLRIISETDLVDHGDESVVHYHEVLSALSYRIAGANLPLDLQRELVKITHRAFPTLKSLPKPNVPVVIVMATCHLQAIVRGHLYRKKQAELEDQREREKREKAEKGGLFGGVNLGLGNMMGFSPTPGSDSGGSPMTEPQNQSRGYGGGIFSRSKTSVHPSESPREDRSRTSLQATFPPPSSRLAKDSTQPATGDEQMSTQRMCQSAQDLGELRYQDSNQHREKLDDRGKAESEAKESSIGSDPEGNRLPNKHPLGAEDSGYLSNSSSLLRPVLSRKFSSPHAEDSSLEFDARSCKMKLTPLPGAPNLPDLEVSKESLMKPIDP